MDLDSILTLVREGFHLGIAFLLLSYQPHGARHRYCVSFIAMIMAASNLALGAAQLTRAIEPKHLGGQWLNIGACGSLFWRICLCRGNVAKMIPNRTTSAPR